MTLQSQVVAKGTTIDFTANHLVTTRGISLPTADIKRHHAVYKPRRDSQQVLFRMVAGADQWTAFDIAEPHLEPLFLELGEDIGMNKLRYRQVLGAGLKVLAEG